MRFEIAHWLAIEGVQPSIPQNPTTAESRNQDLIPKGPGANPPLSAVSDSDNVTVKPLVKHILSKELQLYFGKICSAVLDESNDEYRVAALASIRNDPGLHQLVPYFVQFISEKVTHNLKSLLILTQIVHLTSAMLDNESLYVDPYVRPPTPSSFPCQYTNHLLDRFHCTRYPHLLDRSSARVFDGSLSSLSAPQPRRSPSRVGLQEVFQILTHSPTAPCAHLPQTYARSHQTIGRQLRRYHRLARDGRAGSGPSPHRAESERIRSLDDGRDGRE